MGGFLDWFQQGFGELFLQLVNMAVTASYVALAVLLARILLRRAPKRFSCALWGAVGFRLALPVSFSLPVTFLGMFAPRMSAGSGGTLARPEYVPLAYAGGGFAPETGRSPILLTPGVGYQPPIPPGNSADPMEILVLLCTLVWAAGLLALLAYSIVSYARVLRRVRTATRLDNARCEAARARLGLRRAVRVCESDRVASPFVCGLLRPRVIVPAGLPERELDVVLAHELVHIKRFDYLIKPAAFLLLAVYWFNPLFWLCFALFSKDLEMSCDERVLRSLGEAEKAGYSASLLALAAPRRFLRGSPLAFGETGVKSRIKNALHYKKPALWAIVGAAVLVIALVIFLTANPAGGAQALGKHDFSCVWVGGNYYELTGEQTSRLRELFQAGAWRETPEGSAAEYASASESIVFSTAKSGMLDDTILMERIEGGRARFTLSREGAQESVWTVQEAAADEVESYLLETLPHPLAGRTFDRFEAVLWAEETLPSIALAPADFQELLHRLAPLRWESCPALDPAELMTRGAWSRVRFTSSADGSWLELYPPPNPFGGSAVVSIGLSTDAGGGWYEVPGIAAYNDVIALLRAYIDREQGSPDPLEGLTIEQFWSWDTDGESPALPVTAEQAKTLREAMRTEEWVCLPQLAERDWGSGYTLAPLGRFPRLTLTGNTVLLREEADGGKAAWYAPSETYSRVFDVIRAIQGNGPIGDNTFTRASWNGTDYDLIPERANNILGAPSQSAYWEEIPGGYRGSFDPQTAMEEILLTASPTGALFTVYPWVEGITLVRVIPEPLSGQWNRTDYWAPESVGSNLMQSLQSIRYGDREAERLVETIPEMTRLSAGYVQRVELSEPNSMLQTIAEPSYVRKLVEKLQVYPRGEQAESPSLDLSPDYELNVVLEDGTVLFYDDYGDRVRMRFYSPEGYSLYDTFFYQADPARGKELLGLAREGVLASPADPFA